MSGIELLPVVGGNTQAQTKARAIWATSNRLWNTNGSGLWWWGGRRGYWICSVMRRDYNYNALMDILLPFEWDTVVRNMVEGAVCYAICNAMI